MRTLEASINNNLLFLLIQEVKVGLHLGWLVFLQLHTCTVLSNEPLLNDFFLFQGRMLYEVCGSV